MDYCFVFRLFRFVVVVLAIAYTIHRAGAILGQRVSRLKQYFFIVKLHRVYKKKNWFNKYIYKY